MAKRQEAKPRASDSNASSPIEPAKEAAANDLPVVEAPKLDGSEAVAPPAVDAVDEKSSDPISDSAASVPLSRSLRFAMLVASVAAAAALGSFVGALSASGIAHVWPAAAAKSDGAETSALQAVKAELAQLSALKANLDAVMRNANNQFAKVADRLDRVEHAQIEPSTKIAHIADAVDRLEKHSAASPETTASIAPSQPAAAPEPKLAERILHDWIVQDVRGGHALVESSYGGVFDVTAGNVLPGLGRVETIKRQDGQWVVVTARGLITSAP